MAPLNFPQNDLGLLDPNFRKKVDTFLATLMERRIYVVVIETQRTHERQRILFDSGKSTTMNSKHLTGEAIDIAPVKIFEDVVREIIWDTEHLIWIRIGEIAESLGLEWGGRWKSFKDYVHFQDAS